jgi:DNA end-binding protein Ku
MRAQVALLSSRANAADVVGNKEELQRSSDPWNVSSLLSLTRRHCAWWRWSSAVAPRAYWKGFLKLSLVSCPIALFPASTERDKISFHQINRETGNRIRYRKVDAETGDEVEQADIVKGYEVDKGQYIELDPEELQAVAIESKRTIEIDKFVPKDEIDELYIRDPYFVIPDGEAGQQAFAVIREAIRKEGMIALGKIVFTSREHIIALEARDNGMIGTTLRYPYEVRSPADYFDDIEDEKVPKDMLDLATHIVKTKEGKFEPEKFEDQYEDALKDVIRKKQKGEKLTRPSQPKQSNVINLMDALRQSVKAGGSADSRAGRAQSRSRSLGPKKSARKHPRRRKAS